MTNQATIQIKGGNLANENLLRLKVQLEAAKDLAAELGLPTAIFAYKSGQTIPTDMQKVIDSVGGITVDTFD